MFKKTTSEQETKSTLISELKNEFAPYIITGKARLFTFLNEFPYQVFGAMFFIILLSIAFFTLQSKSTSHLETDKIINVERTNQQFNQLKSSGAAISKLMDVHSKMKKVLLKDTLNHSDSLLLEHLLKEIKSINPRKKP